MSFYQEDLAYVHDVDFGNVATNAAQTVLELLPKNPSNIISLGCGSGIFPKIVSEAGHQVLGIDYSADMIEIAKKKAPLATFEVKSFLNVSFPTTDIITAIGEVFNYLVDDNNTLETLTNLFQEVYNALTNGGYFVFDILEIGLLGKDGFELRAIHKEDWQMLLEKRVYPEINQMDRNIILYRKVKNEWRRSEEVHRVQLYNIEEIKHILEKIGFEVKLLDHYANLKFHDHKIGFVCSKK